MARAQTDYRPLDSTRRARQPARRLSSAPLRSGPRASTGQLPGDDPPARLGPKTIQAERYAAGPRVKRRRL